MTITLNDLKFDRSDRMRKALRVAGIGVEEMAEYIGVNRNTVGSWLNGRNEPSRATVMAFASRCEVPYEWLELGVLPPEGGSDPIMVRPEGFEPPAYWSVVDPTLDEVFWSLVANLDMRLELAQSQVVEPVDGEL